VVAAALAIDGKTGVQKLTAKLKEQKAVLSPDDVPATAAPAQRIDPAKLPGIVGHAHDNARRPALGSVVRWRGQWKGGRTMSSNLVYR
jgi:hypothetical protein